MLKLTTGKQTDRQTNEQTGQKQYAPDHSIRGHKNFAHFRQSRISFVNLDLVCLFCSIIARKQLDMIFFY